jgi:benzoyl-CoA 2,3-epoxidase subunit B
VIHHKETVLKLVEDRPKLVQEPSLGAINMRLRDNSFKDCPGGISRSHKTMERYDSKLGSVVFYCPNGGRKGTHATLKDHPIDSASWARGKAWRLPSKDDGAFIEGLMKACRERGACPATLRTCGPPA